MPYENKGICLTLILYVAPTQHRNEPPNILTPNAAPICSEPLAKNIQNVEIILGCKAWNGKQLQASSSYVFNVTQTKSFGLEGTFTFKRRSEKQTQLCVPCSPRRYGLFRLLFLPYKVYFDSPSRLCNHSDRLRMITRSH